MSETTVPFVYINDCFYEGEANATIRAAGRIAACKTPFAFTPISLREEPNTLAFQLEEVLQTCQGGNIVVGANLASRDLIKHINITSMDISNGLPFVTFQYLQTTVITTANPEVIRMAMKLSERGVLVDEKNQSVQSITVLDIPDVLDLVPEEYYFTAASKAQNKTQADMKNYITNTQFRSMYFVPLVADAIMQGDLDMSKLPQIPLAELDAEFSSQYRKYWGSQVVHYIDNFGNCKTGLRSIDIDFEVGATYEVTFDGQDPIELTAVNRLTDVDSREMAIIPGSSGFGYDFDSRLVEFVINGDAFAWRALSGIKPIKITEGTSFEIRKK